MNATKKQSPDTNKNPRHKKTPYWWLAIERAEKRGFFTDAEKRNAGNWTTCACGKQDPRIKIDEKTGSPIDNELNTLGIQFCDYVFYDNPTDARKALIKIEERSAQLLKEYDKCAKNATLSQ